MTMTMTVSEPSLSQAVYPRWPVKLLSACLLSCVSACGAEPPSQQAKRSATLTANKTMDVAQLDVFHEFGLTIYGYNYTDTAIGSFEVNGRGGGNLAASTATSAGGSSVCCVALFTPLPKTHTMTVKWNRIADIWCEQEVPFTGPVPANAEYLEVHFYRDGHIEIAATAVNSPPRLKLERLQRNSRHTDPTLNINNDAKYSRCRDGYR